MLRSVCNFHIVYVLSVFVCCISDVRNSLSSWGDRLDVAQKLLSLLNSYTPKEVRQSCLGEHLMFPWHQINSLFCVPSCEHWIFCLHPIMVLTRKQWFCFFGRGAERHVDPVPERLHRRDYSYHPWLSSALEQNVSSRSVSSLQQGDVYFSWVDLRWVPIASLCAVVRNFIPAHFLSNYAFNPKNYRSSKNSKLLHLIVEITWVPVA